MITKKYEKGKTYFQIQGGRWVHRRDILDFQVKVENRLRKPLQKLHFIQGPKQKEEIVGWVGSILFA